MNGKQKVIGLFLSGLMITTVSSQLVSKVQAKEQSSELSSHSTTESQFSEEMSTVEETASPSSETTETTEVESSTTSEREGDTTYQSTEQRETTTESQNMSSNESSSQGQLQTTTQTSETTSYSEQNNAPELPALVEKEQIEENYEFSVAINQTTTEFIEAIGSDAQEIAWENDLYASVMIAQAILETGSGNSQLARAPYYNLFGIKGAYQGQSVNFSTNEDNGSGNLYVIQSNFRKYPSYKESLEDYAALLTGGISGNDTFYQNTWKTHAKTYQEATASLTGRYATDTHYDQKLNALIDAYNLTKFDRKNASTEEKTSKKKSAQPKKNAKVASKKEVSPTTNEQVVASSDKEELFYYEWPASVQLHEKLFSGSSARQLADQIVGTQVLAEERQDE